jgi:hypothetical protein
MSSYLEDAINELVQEVENEVLTTFNNGDDISISLIQRRCTCGFNSASRVFNKLLAEGTIVKTSQNGVSKFQQPKS